jgi:hypothetical protein
MIWQKELMDNIFTMVTAAVKSFSSQPKNAQSCLKIFSSISAAKKNAMENLSEDSVQEEKIEETLEALWKTGATTSRDVKTSQSEAKFANKVPLATNVKTKPQEEFFWGSTMLEYMVKVDSALFMISSILHQLKSGKPRDIRGPRWRGFRYTYERWGCYRYLGEVVRNPKEKSAANIAVDMFEAHTEENSANATV